MTTVGQVVDIDTGVLSARFTPGGRIMCQVSVAVSTVDNVTQAQDNGWIHCPIVREYLTCDGDPEDLAVVAPAWAAGLGWEAVTVTPQGDAYARRIAYVATVKRSI